MNTERTTHWRARWVMPALFAASFGSTTLAIWPAKSVDSRTAARQSEPRHSAADSVPQRNDPPPAAAAMAENDEPPATPAPTLQELSVSSDMETRTEAQALLDVLTEEAAADK